MMEVCVFSALPAFGSCTCKPASSSLDGNVLYGQAVDPTVGYDCTCDETDDCAASHIRGGKSTLMLINYY